ncbi:MAG: phosphoribosyltransferase [Euryarchaeota archaeon]|nr:phosphoribosyltransferase [Euryarchaeota archaeon]
MNEPPLTLLYYRSLLAYCPSSTTQRGIDAKKVMKAVKNDLPVSISGLGELLASEMIAMFLKKYRIFLDLFGENCILVPVPRSSPIRKGALWPSFRIARAMEKHGLGKVRVLIDRIIPVPKSSLSPPSQRPTPTNHYRSMSFTSKLDIPSKTKIILIDDIITRGHTFMGAMWHIKTALPEAEISAFAAMRTISNEIEFKGLIDPVGGEIIYRQDHDDCLRRP